MQVREGIHVVQVPVPYPLRFVNTYLCEDENGWTLIDTGCNTPETQEFWRRTLGQYGIAPGALRIVVTHFHPDHLGSAGWLQRQWDAPVTMHRPDYEWMLYQWEPTQEFARLQTDLFVRNGCPVDVAAAIYRQFTEQRDHALPLPESVQTVVAGEEVRLAGRSFEVLWAPGHADWMMMLYQKTERLLVAADAILPHITPNVGVWPRCRTHPLSDYFETLGKIKAIDPLLSLPGHGKRIERTAVRVDEIVAHHEMRLREMERLVSKGFDSAYDVAMQYFDLSGLSPHQVRFALAETIAHLEYLVEQNRLHRCEDEGEVRFAAAAEMLEAE